MKLDRVVLIASLLLAGIGGPWFYRQMRSLPQAHHLAARADQRIVTIEVGGMMCESCEKGIAGELALIDGVHASEVRHGMKRAYVVVSRDVPDSTLVAAIEQAGDEFTARVVAK